MDLNEIESFLDIEIGDKLLRNGKKRKNKNQYYYFQDQYYIVKLTQEKWFLAEDCKKTRRLLRLHCWFFVDGYARTAYCGSKKFWHQLYLNYENGLCCDHINNKRFDNRSENLRIVTQRQNNRNKTKPSNNTSGKQGVCRCTLHKGKYHYWKVLIIDNDGKHIQKLFSIDKYGDDEAKRLAIEKRLELEEELGYIGD